MFISSEAYLAAISNATETDQSLSIAVAFWGSGSENLLNSATGKVRIICNLLIGGTNPEPISIMLDKTNIEIRHSSTLHAKVLLCDDRAIVGSANYSTNGLHYEDDELSGWDEAGIETRDPNLLKSIQDWFENLWMTSDVVTPSDIELAQFRWDIARRNRISQSAKTGLLNLPLSALKDKAIYVALWTNDPSVEAVETINSILEDTSVAIGGTAIDPGALEFYESWEDLPPDSTIIDIKVGPRFSITVNGLYRRIPRLDKTFTYGDGSGGSIQVVLHETKVLDNILDTQTKRQLTKMLRPHIRDIMNKATESGNIAACLPLYDLLTR